MNQIGTALNLGFGLVLLWLVYYRCRIAYRIDHVRHDLFELRNELFLYAANGGVSFKDEAYTNLRRRIEALIRFAHIMTLSRIILVGIQQHKTAMKAVEVRQRHWDAALAKLPQESQQKLQDIHNQVIIRILVQMVTGNLFLLVLGLVCAPIVRLIAFFRSQSKEESALQVAKDLRVHLIEEQAMLAQECEPVAA